LLTQAHIQPYSSFGDLSIQQIAPAILLALLLHALALAALYWSPAEPPLVQSQTIEVSLDAPPSHTQVLEKRPPQPQPIPDERPALIPAPELAQPTPPVAEMPPQTSTAVAAPSQNSTPPAEEIHPLFRLTRMPGFLRKIEAVYPASERRAGIQANVLAEVTINSQGIVLDVRILKSGGATFDEAVKQALQKSTFTPGMIEGKPVGTRFQVPFRFNLN